MLADYVGMRVKNLVGYLLLILLLIVLAFESCSIYAIAERVALSANVIFANADNCKIAFKHPENERNAAIKAAKSILCSGIKLKATEINCSCDQIVCYSRNVILVLDTNSMLPVYLIYDSVPRSMIKNESECEEFARIYMLKNLPRGYSSAKLKFRMKGVSDNVCAFEAEVNGKRADISVRMDTGSIVYYSAKELFS